MTRVTRGFEPGRGSARALLNDENLLTLATVLDSQQGPFKYDRR